MILEHIDLWKYCIYVTVSNTVCQQSHMLTFPLALTSSGNLSPVLLGLWPRLMMSVFNWRERRMEGSFPDSLGDPQAGVLSGCDGHLGSLAAAQ